MPSEADTGVDWMFPFAASCGMMRLAGAKDLRRWVLEDVGRGLAGGEGDCSCGGGFEVERPRGRPRRKEPKMVERNAGGDSSIRFPTQLCSWKKRRRRKRRKREAARREGKRLCARINFFGFQSRRRLNVLQSRHMRRHATNTLNNLAHTRASQHIEPNTGCGTPADTLLSDTGYPLPIGSVPPSSFW